MFSNRAVVLIIAITAGLFVSVHSRCAFTQNCTDPKNPKTCGLPYEVDTEPFEVTKWSKPPACPDLMTPGGKICCNDGQNTLLVAQLMQLSITFGSLNGDGGCDLCAANLMRYFCHFTCNPNQAQYLKVNGYVNVTDKNKTVLSVNYSNSFETACEIYESCKTTAYVAMMPAFQSGKGLLYTLGQMAPAQGPTLINMKFEDSHEKGIYLPNADKCHELVNTTDKFGYKTYKNCSCNNCQSACTSDGWDYRTALPRELEGFDVNGVLAFYGFTIMFALICQFIVRKKSKEIEKEEEEVSRRLDYQEAPRA